MHSRGAQLFSLDDKGGEWLWRSWVAIKSKWGDCWHYGIGLELWHRFCPWWQLYLMTDLISGLQNEEKVIYAGSSRQSHVYTRVGRFEGAYAYTCTFMQGKARICWKTYLWSRVVSPWYLSLWFWTMVSRQKCWSQSIGLVVLSYYGFGPWYWERPKTIKGGRRSFGKVSLESIEYLTCARSETFAIGVMVQI